MRLPLKARMTRLPDNPSRVLLDDFAAEAGAVGTDSSFKVLDAGAGEQPYKKHFAHVSYESADVAQWPGLDYVCDMANMPVPDATYDMVFCSQALEHVPNPVQVLREFHRILKPEGQAWLSAPLFFPEHVKPFDFFRYTRFAWRNMARRAGFKVQSIDWLEGYYATLSYQLEMAYKVLPRDMTLWRLVLLHLSRKLARRELEERYLPPKGMPKNYKVVLIRP
ncbi:MAG: class I SAM-dependent methyltransferase [Nocardioides sp.]